MTVCQIFPHYAPVLAGAAERFRRYAPGLAERGVKTSVITSCSDPAFAAHENIDGCVDVTRMETGTIARERDQRLYKAAEQHLKAKGRGGPRVVQTIKMDRRIYRSLWQIKQQGRALMYVSTMVEPETWGRTALHRWANLQLQVWSQRLFDAVIVGSPVMAAAQRRLGVSEHRLQIISHGVDTQRFQPAGHGLLRPDLVAKQIPANAKICLYVGHLIPRKGVFTLLQAWSIVAEKHPDAWLVLVGSVHRPTISSDQERHEIETYQNAVFRDLQSIPRVLHIQQQPDIQRWYQMADVFVFPSIQEGFPNALLEAMSTGLPCLTRRFLGFPEGQLEEGSGTIEVVPEGADAWAAAMTQILNDRSRRVRMGQMARQLVLRDHSLQHTLQRYASIYHSLALKYE